VVAVSYCWVLASLPNHLEVIHDRSYNQTTLPSLPTRQSHTVPHTSLCHLCPVIDHATASGRTIKPQPPLEGWRPH